LTKRPKQQPNSPYEKGKKKKHKSPPSNLPHVPKKKKQPGASSNKRGELHAEIGMPAQSSIHDSTSSASSGKSSSGQPKDLVQALAEYDDNPVEPSNTVPADPEAIERGDVPMTIVGHLDELRSRIIKSLVVIALITVGAFIFSEEILQYITRPFTVTGFKLNVFKLTEGFVIRLKVSAIIALLIGLPFLAWQAWRFILPAISGKDRMFSRVSLLVSALLFYTGVAFVFYLLVPLTVKVLLGFVSKDMISTIGANDYITLVFFFCVIMGILFELPIIIMVLTRIGIITPSFLVLKRKYAIVLAFFLAAIITPTQDLLTMCIVAIPLVILYEASILVSKLTVVRKKKKELSG